MVFHDYTLIRMTGKEEKLKNLTAAELQALSLAGTEQTIPTFREVLELVDGRVPLLVELKGEDLNSALCPKVAELLKGYQGPYCVESFNPLLVKNIKKYLPHVYCGQLYTNVCRDKKKYSPLNLILSAMAFNFLARPDFIAYNLKDRKAFPVLVATKLYKAPRFVWTVRTEEDLETAHRLGEHPIFEK
jgi:glycerophosphoryl diester phosphodiesterase